MLESSFVTGMGLFFGPANVALAPLSTGSIGMGLLIIAVVINRVFRVLHNVKYAALSGVQ